jgi:hypothetical protein
VSRHFGVRGRRHPRVCTERAGRRRRGPLGIWDLAANVVRLSEKVAAIDTIDKRSAALQTLSRRSARRS